MLPIALGVGMMTMLTWRGAHGARKPVWTTKTAILIFGRRTTTSSGARRALWESPETFAAPDAVRPEEIFIRQTFQSLTDGCYIWEIAFNEQLLEDCC